MPDARPAKADIETPSRLAENELALNKHVLECKPSFLPKLLERLDHPSGKRPDCVIPAARAIRSARRAVVLMCRISELGSTTGKRYRGRVFAAGFATVAGVTTFAKTVLRGSVIACTAGQMCRASSTDRLPVSAAGDASRPARPTYQSSMSITSLWNAPISVNSAPTGFIMRRIAYV